MNEEEYNPSCPNDYLKIILQAKTQPIKRKENILTGEEKAWIMLEKMGWKGHGLGKYEQGITIPLIGKKTSKNHGVIININN